MIDPHIIALGILAVVWLGVMLDQKSGKRKDEHAVRTSKSTDAPRRDYSK